MHKINKSKLINQIKRHWQETVSLDVSKDTTVHIVDFIALIRVATKLPDTFEQLAFKLLSVLPKGFRRVDLVADSYFTVTIKGAERNKRGKGAKITIKSPKSKIPREFKKFLSNGENKTRMIEVLFQTFQGSGKDCLETFCTNEIILSREDSCLSLTWNGITGHRLL